MLKKMMNVLEDDDASTSDDCDMEISQSVKNLDNGMFERIESDIKEFERERRQTDRVMLNIDASISGVNHTATNASTSTVSSFDINDASNDVDDATSSKSAEVTPAGIATPVDANSADSHPVAVDAISTESHPVAVDAISTESHPVAVGAVTSESVTTKSHPVAIDTIVADANSTAVVAKAPTVTVQCTNKISVGDGGAVVDMGTKIKSPRATERPRSDFPSASSSSTASQYQRAVFESPKGNELDAKAKKIVEEVVKKAEEVEEGGVEEDEEEEEEEEEDELFTDEEDDIPESTISNMTQKDKQRPEELLPSQLSENGALDEIARPDVEDNDDAEKGDKDGVKINNQDGNEEKGEENDHGMEDEESEDASAVRGLQNSMKNADAEAEVDGEIEPVATASASKRKYYTTVFASDNEGEVNLSEKGKTGQLKLGPPNGIKSEESRPKNGYKLSELKAKAALDSGETSKHVTKSVYTPSDPLVPNNQSHKKQTTLIDIFGKVPSTKPTRPLSPQQQNVAKNAPSLPNNNANGGSSAPVEREPQGNATLSSSAESSQRQSSSMESVSGKPTSISQQPTLSQPSSSAHLIAKGGSSPSKNGAGKSPLKRKSSGAFKFTPPKMANIDLGSDLPIVKKAASSPIKKSKNLFTALPVRLGAKICEFCFKPFLGRHKSSLTIREHIITSQCSFVKQNCSSIGVERTCNQCQKSFEHSKGMYQEIISHLCQEDHDVVCYICGMCIKFSQIFSHMSSEMAKVFEIGVPCSKCKTVMKTARDFYNHIKVYHSAKEVNASIFNRFLYDSMPNYNFILVSLMLTHSIEKV